MSEEKLEFVGKQVRDIYGTFIGKVVGIVTDIDGSIESVGVDCGSAGLKQLAYEQLVIQQSYVIFIPKWRLEAQKLLRQKSLTLKRIKALQDIVAENDGMKEDAELITIKYEKRLNDLDATENAVNQKLGTRLAELDSESKSIKAVLFDAKLQFRSNEMTEEAYQQIKINTDEMIEHIINEKTEINNIKAKLALQTLENISAATSTPAPATTPVADAPSSSSPSEVAPAEPERIAVQQVEGDAGTEENKIIVTANGETSPEASWLNQVMPKN